MSPEVYVSGAAMTPFGRHNDRSMQELAQAAVLGALRMRQSKKAASRRFMRLMSTAAWFSARC